MPFDERVRPQALSHRQRTELRNKLSPPTVDFRLEVTRYFHRELTRVMVCPAERVLGQAGDFSFRGFGEAELALKRKLSLPVSMMWQ